MTFPSVTGGFNFATNQYAEENGPDGDYKNKTRIESFQGISGILHERNGSFLVGVFLTDAEPRDPAPPALNVTKKSASTAPKIGQVFFIGDGKNHRFTVPPTATRLFLGCADAAGWQGPPGYYGNNAGEVRVTVKLN